MVNHDPKHRSFGNLPSGLTIFAKQSLYMYICVAGTEDTLTNSGPASAKYVPTRQSYTMAVVRPEERSAAAGITGVARTIGAAILRRLLDSCSPGRA
jgi:hypothetical protein